MAMLTEIKSSIDRVEKKRDFLQNHVVQAIVADLTEIKSSIRRVDKLNAKVGILEAQHHVTDVSMAAVRAGSFLLRFGFQGRFGSQVLVGSRGSQVRAVRVGSRRSGSCQFRSGGQANWRRHCHLRFGSGGQANCSGSVRSHLAMLKKLPRVTWTKSLSSSMSPRV